MVGYTEIKNTVLRLRLNANQQLQQFATQILLQFEE